MIFKIDFLGYQCHIIKKSPDKSRNKKMIPILGYFTKLGFYALATKLVVSGGMSMWMCSNVENITSITNFTRNSFSTDNLKFSMDHITARIEEAAQTTGYECGDRCSDITEIAKHYKTDISEKLRIDCQNSGSNLMTIGMTPATCDYIATPEGVTGIIDSISYGALEYTPGKSRKTELNPKGSTDTSISVVENKLQKVTLGELDTQKLSERINGLKSFLSDKYNTIVSTTQNARRHIGWLAQGKTKTLEIITELITSFINNLKLFLEKDFLHWKSTLQKKYEDYELCFNYLHQTMNTALSILPFTAVI